MDESEQDANLLQNLACHSCASHIVECIFECLARTTAKIDNKLLRSFVGGLLLQPQILTDNAYAAHVIEKMLLRLCRVLHYEVKNSQLFVTLYDWKSSSELVLTYNKDDPAKSSGLQSDMLSKSERRNFNAAISAVERIFLDESTGAVKTESVVSGCKSASGSVILQVIETNPTRSFPQVAHFSSEIGWDVRHLGKRSGRFCLPSSHIRFLICSRC